MSMITLTTDLERMEYASKLTLKELSFSGLMSRRMWIRHCGAVYPGMRKGHYIKENVRHDPEGR